MNRNTAPEVSAVVPTYRRLALLRRCLRSLVMQRYPRLEILVIDDAGDDNTTEAIQEEFPGISVQRNPSRMGAAASKNEGARRASGELIWFLDSDVEIPDPGLLERMVQTLSEHPEAGAVGGERVLVPDGRWIAVRKWIGPDGMSTSVAIEDGGKPFVTCDYLATSSCMVRADRFQAVGGFDETYGIGSEDTELGFRLRRRGWSVLTGPDLAVHHHAAKAGRTSDLYLRYRNGLRFAIKNFPAPQVLALPAASLIGLLNPARVRLVLDQRPEALKYLPDHLRGAARQQRWCALPTAAQMAASALVRAWAWNLSHLPQTLAARRRAEHP